MVLVTQHPYTLAEGIPLPRSATSVQTRHRNGEGYNLLAVIQLIKTLTHSSRERVSEFVVHAKAAGAKYFFEVTHDLTNVTDAMFLIVIGKETPLITGSAQLNLSKALLTLFAMTGDGPSSSRPRKGEMIGCSTAVLYFWSGTRSSFHP
jgi:hypothetical protein